ncbi:hypothetical protein MKW98_017048 [Papaver atlanticum]|uniref:NAB domain-containing protein n=1 Tax=Papaver atlanticum TaxID=357466 RepID=A0AAD4XYJ4_9MAGN|nr:hypothetical protein MKW98_017048 [Papaver atlanticum]
MIKFSFYTWYKDMATLKHTDSSRKYAFWWDSHISPKNSKWLQENLTDMDAKVKVMIKIIEADADSFARRAEMYYRQRPELMKLVEESYRAYRALAERYDHATGALRQAHKTMSEAFPNQIPFDDDSPPSGSPVAEAPDMPHSIRAFFDPGGFHKEESGLSPMQSRSGGIGNKKGFRQVSDLFGEAVGKDQNSHEENNVPKVLTERKVEESGVSGQNIKSEEEVAGTVDDKVQNLKQMIARLESEKEASLLKYQQSSEKLSSMESKVSHAQEESRELSERAIKAENEVETLKHSLSKVEASVTNYLQCLESISDLENRLSQSQKESTVLNERASKEETEVQTLKQDLTRLEGENEAALLQYKQCLEKISDLETKLLHAEDEARRHNERGDKAEAEVQSLKQMISKLNEAKEAATLQYQQCLNTISDLEIKITRAEMEATRLNNEVATGVEKFHSAEEQHHLLEKAYQSLQMEADTLMQKMGMLITHELVERDEELANLRVRVQEEHIRSMEAEDALINIESLHAKSIEEQEALESELENAYEMMNDMKIQNQDLEDEVQQLTDRNKTLNEKNLSCSMLIKNLQDEVFLMKEAEKKLKEEIDLRLDERNALQQEIYSLKEEINELNGQYHSVIEQVEYVGFKPDSLGLSVTSLLEENSKMKEMYLEEKEDNASLLAKLEQMEKLLEKNVLLENSLSDLNVELEELRGKLMAMEETCRSLHKEKSILVAEKTVLVSQLEIATENLVRLAEKNSFLENSLSDANAELEGSRTESKSLEESFHSIKNEKFGLVTEKDTLVIKLESMRERLEGLEKICVELREKHSYLEKEKESALHEVTELRGSLDEEKKEHASSAQKNEILLGSLEDHIRILHEKHRLITKEFEEEQDKAMKSQFEIFIWQRCIRDIEEKNHSLWIECQKHLEASKSSEKLIVELEQKNLDQQLNVYSLSNEVGSLKMGIHQVLKLLKDDDDDDYECADKTKEHERFAQHVMKKFEEMDSDLSKLQDDKQQLLFEKLVLIAVLQQVTCDLQDSHLDLQNANSKLLEENRCLRKDFSNLKEEKCMLEEENSSLLEETIVLSSLCLVLKSFGTEKVAELKRLSEGLDSLHGINGGLDEEIRMMQEGIKLVEAENINLKVAVEKLVNELNTVSNQNELEFNSMEESNMERSAEIVQLKGSLSALEAENINLKVAVEKLVNELNTVSNQNELEFNSMEASNMERSAEIVQLKGSFCALEGENKEMKSQMLKYAQDMGPLVENIKSLEELVFSHIRSPTANNQETKDTEKLRHDKSSQELSGDHNLPMSDGVPDLLNLQTRVKAVEKALIEMKRLMQQGSMNADIILDTGIREKEKPKSRSNSFRLREVKMGKAVAVEPNEVEHWDDLRKINTRKAELEISDGETVKDIPLDQAASSSSYDRGQNPYTLSRRRSSRIDEQMMEIWDAVEKDRSINMTVSRSREGASPTREIGKSNRHQGSNSSSFTQEDKDMVVDKVEVFKRVSSAHKEGNKQKVLERLTSDSLKLSNLQVTVQDLKKTVEQTPKVRRADNFEYDMVEGQLQEVGEAIIQLLDINNKLRKNLVETFPVTRDGRTVLESEESGNVRRRKVSVEAQRVYEKIGRLELEVQRMQFVLMKLDDEHGTKGTSSAPDRRKRILLRDYLYGDRRSSNRRRKRDRFCGCMKPATDENSG